MTSKNHIKKCPKRKNLTREPGRKLQYEFTGKKKDLERSKIKVITDVSGSLAATAEVCAL